jgi:hypothetical protein
MSYKDKFGSFFGRVNDDGNVIVFHDSGETATQLDADAWPVGSHLSARYEHATGIVLTRADADRLNIAVEA